MRMLSIVACSIAAALMFSACSDDSASSVSSPAGGAGQGGAIVVLDSARNMSVDLKGCYGHPYDALTKTAAENPKAYLVLDDAGYHVVLHNIVDACGYADVVFNNQRVLDTLKVNFEGNSTDCICYTDEWFTIDLFDSDIKYFVYLGTIYEVVSEPLPVRSSSSGIVESSSAVTESSSSGILPQSSADVSSSSELLSSSALVESSSSVTPDPAHLFITDADAQCGVKGYTDDPLVDAAPVQRIRPKDRELPPVAGRYVGTERTSFTIENISFACDVKIDTLDVYVKNQTIYVNAKMDYSSAKRCLCDSKVSFGVDNDTAFWHARWLVFDDGSSINLQNKMEIYDIDVVTVEEAFRPQTQKTTKVSAACQRDQSNSTNAIDVNLVESESTPVATKVAGENETSTITIAPIMLSCGIRFLDFEITASSDTLYVTPNADPDSPIVNCICPTQVTFDYADVAEFANAKYVVFDGFKPVLIQTP